MSAKHGGPWRTYPPSRGPPITHKSPLSAKGPRPPRKLLNSLKACHADFRPAVSRDRGRRARQGQGPTERVQWHGKTTAPARLPGEAPGRAFARESRTNEAPKRRTSRRAPGEDHGVSAFRHTPGWKTQGGVLQELRIQAGSLARVGNGFAQPRPAARRRQGRAFAIRNSLRGGRDDALTRPAVAPCACGMVH